VSPPWQRLVGYQVPLFDKQHKEGWGYIDLLGLTGSGEPVVVELKRGTSADTPLHALLEAVSYAVALRKNWQLMAAEIKALRDSQKCKYCVSDDPEKWTLVLLAPPKYWKAWSPETATGRTVSDSTRKAYRQLRESLAAKGYPVLQAEVRGTEGWDGVTPLSQGPLEVGLVDAEWDASSPC
jgi:hypothetical protein